MKKRIPKTKVIRGSSFPNTKVGWFSWVAVDYYPVSNSVLIGIGWTAKRAEKRLDQVRKEINTYG